MKQNLRSGVFNTDPLLPYQVAALMPWADARPAGQWPPVDENGTVLQSLVGAVKRLQVEYNTVPSWDPLAHVRTHCESVLLSLLASRGALEHTIQRDTVEAVTRPPPMTQPERDELLALVAARRRPRE